MGYIENPKTKGSGILCCIPQKGRCPQGCHDCFFQSGRSYLEPLSENLPNLPSDEEAAGKVIRVNDGNDSHHQRELVLESTKHYPMRFYNTSCPDDLAGYGMPVVLTLNPGATTDTWVHLVDPIPANLMFVRVRTNAWNLELVDIAVKFYTERDNPVPVVLTFMAYFNETVPEVYRDSYVYRKRTINSYWAITTGAWRGIMRKYEDNPFVHSCGKIEGEKGKSACKTCGNCLREYFATMERMSCTT